LYYLFVGSGHWIGTAAVVYAWKHTTVFRARGWRVAGAIAAVHVLIVSAFGGAVLERYLMPLMPLLYVAFAVALGVSPPKWRLRAPLALFVLLIAANFVNPVYPFPWENDLAFASFVSLDEKAADFLENSYPNGVVATMFPLAGALRRPDFGYVAHAMQVRDVEDFSVKSITGLVKDKPDVLAVYSTTWDPLHALENPLLAGMLTRFYGYQPQASAEEIRRILGMRPVARWEMHGQWVEIFEAENLRPRQIVVKRF
jgi:hypothetical protein